LQQRCPRSSSWRKTQGAEDLARRIVHLIVAEEEFDPESMAYLRLMMELRERRRDRFSFWWRLLFTPGAGEWSAVRLPGPLFPLYRGAYLPAGWKVDVAALG
jgi:hypothetical protein